MIMNQDQSDIAKRRGFWHPQAGFLVPVISFILLFYLVFMVFPILYSIVGSFHKWNPIFGTFKFTGFNNYQDIFADKLFWKALRLNLVFTVGVVVARTVLGLTIAVGIASVKWGQAFFRMIYFLPVIAPLIAVSLLWEQIYNPNYGLANLMLQSFGLSGLRWLKDNDLALPSIMLMTVWKEVGYAMVIFLAAIVGVPKDLYEAAMIDGASKRQQFWQITLPMIKPATIFVLITSLISYLQTFGQIFIMTEGGPGTSTYTTVYQIFDEAFVLYNFGTASAISIILFIIILLITLTSLRFTGTGYE